MMGWLGDFLIRYPELALFLALGLGHLIGSYKFRGFSFGPVTGSLFAGILVGQLGDIPVSPTAKSILFMLFLFGIGYTVGPQFGRALKGDGIKALVIGIFVPVVGLLTAYSVAKFLHLDPGLSAGLTSGSLTESAAIGTASDVISHLPLDEAERNRLLGHVVVADSVCYLFGAFGVIFFCGEIGPRLLRLDLKEEARKLEAALHMEPAKGGPSAWRMFDMRAYRMSGVDGKTVADMEASLEGSRLFIPRLRRGGQIVKTDPSTIIRKGDICAIGARREVLVEAFGRVGIEVEDRELLDVPVTAYDVFLTNKAFSGSTLEDIAQSAKVRGVFLRRITRGGLEIPVAPGTVLQRGDVLTLVGTEELVAPVANMIGTPIRPVDVPDYITLGFAVFIGGMAGILLAFPIGKLEVSLSSSVGVLLAGLAVGWLRTHRPLLGRIPDAAVSMMTSLGLASFVAMVGLHAGPLFLGAVQQYGLSLLLGGVVVTSVPLITALYFGRYVLKMNPLMLLGAIAGAQTMTPGLAAVQDKSGSPIAVLGYAAAVPFGHILLAIWGAAIVLLVA